MCIEEVPITGSIVYTCKDDGEPISLTVSDNTRIIRIRSSGGGSRIGRITLTGSRSNSTTFDLLIARGVEEFGEFEASTPLSAAGTHWGGLTGTASVLSQVRLAAAVSGNIPGTVEPPPNETDIGNVTSGTIKRFQVGTSSANGKIAGVVKTTGEVADPSVIVIGEVQANEISETGSIKATTGGRILMVRCGNPTSPGGGWFAGTIDAGTGRINAIEVFGPIGSPSQPATIEAREGILSIVTYPNGDGEPQPVYANIDANTADQLYPPFSELRCGTFTGSIHAGTGEAAAAAAPIILIDGDLAGSLSFESDLEIPIRIEGACLPGSSINIGGSVLASITSEGDLADILIEGDVLSQSGQPDIHIRSDTGRIEEIKVYGNILSDDADGSGHNIFLEAAGGFGWIEAKSIVAFIGSPLGAGNFVPIDHLSSVPSGAVSEFDGEVWCSSFETFDIENPVGNLVSLGHIINFLGVPAGARARFAGVSTSPPGFDGTIRIHAADGLKGQLIFNADAIPNLDWENFDGEMQIPSPTQFETLAMPGYTRSASTFGGGAAGLVPFLLHGPDCVPATTQSPPTLCAGGFRNGTAPITLTFKGPVAFDGQHPITIEMFGGDPGEWLPIATQSYRARRDDQDHRRVFVDTLPSEFPWTPADYRIRPVTAGDGRLRCDDLFVTEAPSVADFTYEFHLNGDCGGAGCDEARCECPGYCFFSDFNRDGGVDNADVEAFYQDWENGLPSADVDLSGGVDGTDVEAFFCLWELGGC